MFIAPQSTLLAWGDGFYPNRALELCFVGSESVVMAFPGRAQLDAGEAAPTLGKAEARGQGSGVRGYAGHAFPLTPNSSLLLTVNCGLSTAFCA